MRYQIMRKAEANNLIRKNPVRFAEKMKSKGPVNRIDDRPFDWLLSCNSKFNLYSGIVLVWGLKAL